MRREEGACRIDSVEKVIAILQDRDVEEPNEQDSCGFYPVATGLAQWLLNSLSIIAHARPVLEDLARRHGEAVYLTVLKDNELIFLDMADYGQHEKAASFVGKRLPSLDTAAGKAIRAFQSRDVLDRIIPGRNELDRRRNRKRSFALEKLQAELDAIRNRGAAVHVETLEQGINSVAAAVRDYAGKIVCALTVLGPSSRMSAGRIDKEIVPSLMEGAEILSMKLGYSN